MALIKRYLLERIIKDLENRKILIIYGARQVGKTTLVKEVLSRYQNSLYLNGDFMEDQQRLDEPSRRMVEQFKQYDLLVIDEAQRIEDIGIKLKVIFDTLPNLKIIATGSSAFEIANSVNEPLTGRSLSYSLYPISVGEAVHADRFDTDNFLVYGSYPGVVTLEGLDRKRAAIQDIASNYLFKDVLNIEYIRNPRSLEHLLKALADQLGSEVSVHELSNTLDLDAKTVSRYLDILEKLHIIFPLYPHASNVRKSITKKKKYYFYDLGIRNAVIGNFSPLSDRTDKGALWENFCIVERIKRNDAEGRFIDYRFWRSYQGEEIDLIEIEDQHIRGFECKWKDQPLPHRLENIYKNDLGGIDGITLISVENFKQLLCYAASAAMS
jgi:uncharacterized protein